MKKIKYGNKKGETENQQLQNVIQGDEICEAVCGSCDDQYLSYINHLLKNTKTPNKNIPQKRLDQNSSDEQPFQKWQNQLSFQPKKSQFKQKQAKPRRYSEASAKISMHNDNQEIKKSHKTRNQSTKVSPRGKFIEPIEKEQALPKSKKRKIEYVPNDSAFKNQQKTMQLSRNTVQNSKFKEQRHFQFDRDAHKKSRITHKSRDKYYVTSQNYEQTDRQPSIQIPLKKQPKKKQQKLFRRNFIDNINQYITTLQQNQSNFQMQSKKQHEDDSEKYFKKMTKLRKGRIDDDDTDLQQIFKQNVKLNKKVKNYEQKVSELDQQISNHLDQCKKRQKTYKDKINYLLRGLIQAFMKIDAQQSQIATLKDLHRSYGQKVKQIENKYVIQSLGRMMMISWRILGNKYLKIQCLNGIIHNQERSIKKFQNLLCLNTMKTVEIGDNKVFKQFCKNDHYQSLYEIDVCLPVLDLIYGNFQLALL